MLTNLLKYKDYHARIAFDPSADAFHGRVIGTRDVIDFYGRTPEELREELKKSVDEYLAWCAEEGTKPEKTWQGKLTIRVDEGLRRRLAVVYWRKAKLRHRSNVRSRKPWVSKRRRIGR